MTTLLDKNIGLAEYIWLDINGNYRQKTCALKNKIHDLKDFKIWNFDGSSTGQALGHDSEIYLKPVFYVKDPFRRYDTISENYLVLCDCIKYHQDIDNNSSRSDAEKIFEKYKDHEPWYGIEQEYVLYNQDGKTPLGWPLDGYPGPQGPYYCGVGAENVSGRTIVERHLEHMAYCNLNFSGINAEVMKGQWEYQIGPCVGIDIGDQLHLSRYILLRICEDFGVVVSFDPKPVKGDWNGSGCHTNFSTKKMREKNGYKDIVEACEKLGLMHSYHIEKYGKGNERRLTGEHETSSITKFSYGVGNRGSSIRISKETENQGYGYLEDRRPSSNCDPYIVSSLLLQTVCE